MFLESHLTIIHSILVIKGKPLGSHMVILKSIVNLESST